MFIFKYANVAPAVAVEDLRRLTEIYAQLIREYPQGGVSLDIRAYESGFSVGFDLVAAWSRYSLFAVVKVFPGFQLIPMALKEDLAREPIPDYILEVAAKFPMVGPSREFTQTQRQFFDRKVFLEELEKARAIRLSNPGNI